MNKMVVNVTVRELISDDIDYMRTLAHHERYFLSFRCNLSHVSK